MGVNMGLLGPEGRGESCWISIESMAGRLLQSTETQGVLLSTALRCLHLSDDTGRETRRGLDVLRKAYAERTPIVYLGGREIMVNQVCPKLVLTDSGRDLSNQTWYKLEESGRVGPYQKK